MRRGILSCVVLVACITPAVVMAGDDLHDELDSLATQVRDQARQLEDAREANRRLEDRIHALEQRMAEAAPVSEISRSTPDDPSRLEAVESQAIVAISRQEGILKRLSRSVETTGYTAVHFADFNGETSDFRLATMELLFDAHPTQRVSFRGEFEFEANGPSADNSSEASLEVEEAWIQYSITPWLRPRAGVVLVPFGTYSTQHFDTVRDLTDDPLLASRIVPTTWSETGLGVTGGIGMSEWGKRRTHDLGFSYQAFVINGLTDRISDTSLRAARGAQAGDNNDNKAVVGRIALTSTGLFELGASGYYGKYDPNDNHVIAGFDTDWELRYGPLRLLGEYALFKVERGLSDSGITVPRSLEGLYIEPSYTFWPTLLDPLKPWFQHNPTITAIARWGFAQIDDDADPGTGNNREERLTLGLNLRPTESLVLKFEWQRNTTAREALDHGDRDGFLASLAASF